LPVRLSESERRSRIDRIATVLRSFGIVDNGAIAAKLMSANLPTLEAVAGAIQDAGTEIRRSADAQFIAKCIIAELGKLPPEREAWVAKYGESPPKLTKIKSGRAHAGRFHDAVTLALTGIFDGVLSRPRKEVDVDDRRGRIDIVFSNVAKEGFFYDLRHVEGVKCPMVFFECKNYTGELTNTDFNQISSRLNDQRGQLGFVVCRSIRNRRATLNHCRDKIKKSEFIIAVDDDDLMTMHSAKQSEGAAGVDEMLRQLYDNLFM